MKLGGAKTPLRACFRFLFQNHEFISTTADRALVFFLGERPHIRQALSRDRLFWVRRCWQRVAPGLGTLNWTAKLVFICAILKVEVSCDLLRQEPSQQAWFPASCERLSPTRCHASTLRVPLFSCPQAAALFLRNRSAYPCGRTFRT
jgi:hypothetical protein